MAGAYKARCRGCSGRCCEFVATVVWPEGKESFVRDCNGGEGRRWLVHARDLPEVNCSAKGIFGAVVRGGGTSHAVGMC